MTIIKRTWIHLAIIALTIAYFFAAPKIYANCIRKYGKPVSASLQIPVATNQLIISPLELTSAWIGDEDIYDLRGWGLAWDLLEDYQRFIVLESPKTKYFFPIETTVRNDLKSVFSTDVSRFAGLTAFIAKNVVPFGTYRIGVLFVNEESQRYILTNQVLVFSANAVSITSFDRWLDEESLVRGSPVSNPGVLTDSLVYGIDELIIQESFDQECIQISGYVFSESTFGQLPESVSLLIDAGEGIIEYPTVNRHRPDVPIYYRRADIGDPGFLGCIPTSNLSSTSSRIGFRIIYPEGDVHQWTSISLRKENNKYYNLSLEISQP